MVAAEALMKCPEKVVSLCNEISRADWSPYAMECPEKAGLLIAEETESFRYGEEYFWTRPPPRDGLNVESW